MKKIYICLFAAIAAVGCLKDEPTQTPEINDGVNVLEVTAPLSLTKTTLVDNGDYYSVNWTANDVISVNGQESSGLTVDTENAKKAVFTFEEKVSAPYCSVYPASAYMAESLAEGTAKVVIPAEQTYVEGNFDPTAAIMIGHSEVAGKLTFEHAVAYMQIKVTTADGAAVKSVSVAGNAKETMSGEFTATFANATLVNDSKDGSVVTVTSPSGFATGKEVIIAIPARNYASGVSVTLTDVNGHSKLLKSTVAFAANAGVVYSTEMELKGKGIYGINDYIAFAEAVMAGDYSAFVGADGEVNLMADITLEAGNFKYVDAVFNGVFDGNGHTLTSPERTTPLFNTIGADGVVKNLNTAGTFTSFANGFWCAASSFAKINLGLIENCNNSVNTDLTYNASTAGSKANGLVLGCFVGQNGGIIRDSKNTGNTIVNVKLTNDAAYAAFSAPCIAGGFAAIGHTVNDNPGLSDVGYKTLENVHAGTFVRCKNEGELKVSVLTTITNLARKTTVSAVGGICGLVRYDGVRFESCVNSGNISRISNGENSNDGSCFTGGILGQSAINHTADNPHAIDASKGFNTVITKCTNSGIVTNNVRYIGDQYGVHTTISSSNGTDGRANRKAAAGGIVGALIGASESAKAEVSSCISSGKILAGWNGQKPLVGGVVGYAKNAIVSENTVSCEITNATASNEQNIGIAGGLVGTAYAGVSISGGSSKPKMTILGAGGVNVCVGLCVGCSIGNVSISNVKVGGTSQYTDKYTATAGYKRAAGTYTITNDNYTDYIYNELYNSNCIGDNTNYATTVTNVTWED